jgi:hypothetical protein
VSIKIGNFILKLAVKKLLGVRSCSSDIRMYRPNCMIKNGANSEIFCLATKPNLSSSKKVSDYFNQ